MKTKLILLGVLLGATLYSPAQEIDDIYATKDGEVNLEVVTPAKPVQETKKERKEREKRLKMLNDSVAHNLAVRALQKGYWVLLADRITLGRSAYSMYGLSNNSNFIFQQGDDGMVQVAFNQVNPGLNGLGGITLEGKVANVKLTTDKKGNIHYSYHISSTEINALVYVTVYSNSGNAEAYVDSTFGPGRLTLYGKIVPYDHSKH